MSNVKYCKPLEQEPLNQLKPIVKTYTAQAANDSLEPIPFNDNIDQIVGNYLAEMKNETVRDLYKRVINTVEAPLLAGVMRHSNQNQSIAATKLGINRGTLRKKLKEHDLL